MVIAPCPVSYPIVQLPLPSCPWHPVSVSPLSLTGWIMVIIATPVPIVPPSACDCLPWISTAILSLHLGECLCFLALPLAHILWLESLLYMASVHCYFVATFRCHWTWPTATQLYVNIEAVHSMYSTFLLFLLNGFFCFHISHWLNDMAWTCRDMWWWWYDLPPPK